MNSVWPFVSFVTKDWSAFTRNPDPSGRPNKPAQKSTTLEKRKFCGTPHLPMFAAPET